MIPGMNPRQMKQAMKRMGIQQTPIPAKEVIIRLDDGREVYIGNPSVVEVNMMGDNTLQITGEQEIRETDTTPTISKEDIQTVVDQAGCSTKEAETALTKYKGDLAEAILSFQ